jgi:2-polyprenyl-3-methyl-5-hydroxy-6-metoxy-1,4-benzoquinol methylase
MEKRIEHRNFSGNGVLGRYGESRQALVTEKAPDCPLCHKDGESLYKGLWDSIWPTPGEWVYRFCTGCEVLWLDPRPTLECFNVIYPEDYVIHSEPIDSLSTRSTFLTNLRLEVKLEVLRRAYGYSLRATNPFACFIGMVAACIPGVRHWAGFTVRFLPECGGRLLDVGCGSGGFLLTMSKLGWEVQGVEPDTISASFARKAGLNVYGGTVESLPLEPSSFHAITLNHVIEHLPNPVETLKRLGVALRPGGWLVSISPNPSSLLSRWFQMAWRGLEPPRHFVLPSPRALMKIAERAGLEPVVWTTARNNEWIARESISISRHGNIREYKGKYLPCFITMASRVLTLFKKDLGEEVILIALKK